MRVIGWGLVVLAGGCSADSYLRAADREGWAIAAERMRIVEDFRRELVDPRAEGPPPEPRPVPAVDLPARLALDDAIRTAVKHSRTYKNQEEGFYLAALGLGLTRHNFLDPIFGGSISYNASDGRAIELSDSTALAVTATQMLPTGGTLSLGASASIDTLDVGDERHQDAGYTGSITLSQQLWRGAGHAIAFEPLTQAERDVVYAARAFETFRQGFTIGIIRSYLDLVTAKKGLAITRSQLEGQEYAFRLAEAKFRVGQTGQEDVLRAEETFLNAQNSLLDAEESYKVRKDRFKIELGVPIDVDFEIVEEIPEPRPLEMESDRAVAAALANRLDLVTQREQVADRIRGVDIARNALLPDLTLGAGYTASSSGLASLKELTLENHVGTLALTLTFPFERRAERNGYRAALIGLDQAQRDLSRAEDDVVLNIRSLVRDLRTQQLTIENTRKNVEVLKRRITRASIDFDRGRASNRDVVEATDKLAEAENQLLGREVAYYVSRLNLLQQMGLLFVDKEGRIIP